MADTTPVSRVPSGGAGNLLFDPIDLGELHLSNRIVMAPLTRSRSNDEGVPPSFAAEYYSERAAAGLIVAEATNVSAQARGYAFTPGIWSEDQVSAWRPIVGAVREQGGTFFLQLYHGGRISHPDLNGGVLPVAPSALKPVGQAFTNHGLKDFVTPRALETNEIASIVADYRRAAENAKAAGFDGVEIHSASNYLLEQFIRDSTDQRTDAFGGSIENGLRFPLQVAKAVVDVWGADRVGLRISPVAIEPGKAPIDGDPMATYGAYVETLSALGLLYVHCVEAGAELKLVTSEIDIRRLRRRFSGIWIGNNEYDLARAGKALDEGDADLISFGRPFIANPDLVSRFRNGAPLAEAPRRYWYGGTSVGYSDWPAVSSSRQTALENRTSP